MFERDRAFYCIKIVFVPECFVQSFQCNTFAFFRLCLLVDIAKSSKMNVWKQTKFLVCRPKWLSFCPTLFCPTIWWSANTRRCFGVMSRIGGIINEMNNRTFLKERQINNRFINLLNKQRKIVLLILDMYIVLTLIRRHLNVMDIRWTLKQVCVQ